MLKKILISLLLITFCFTPNYSIAALRDELPPLERLSDLTIGIKRIEKGLKYEKKMKFDKAQKMYGEAISFLLKETKKQKINANTYFYLGFAYDKLNDTNNSIIYYNLGLVVEPNNVNINKFLGNLYIKNNQPLKAKLLLENIKNCNCNQYIELKDNIDNLNN